MKICYCRGRSKLTPLIFKLLKKISRLIKVTGNLCHRLIVICLVVIIRTMKNKDKIMAQMINKCILGKKLGLKIKWSQQSLWIPNCIWTWRTLTNKYQHKSTRKTWFKIKNSLYMWPNKSRRVLEVSARALITQILVWVIRAGWSQPEFRGNSRWEQEADIWKTRLLLKKIFLIPLYTSKYSMKMKI
jgi:hypothetical protein